MITVGTLIQKNSIVKRLIVEGDISAVQLKKIYRRLCKMTHPDLQKEDGAEFILLKEEYEEALANLDALKSHLGTNADSSVLSPVDIRRMFYDALRHYLAAGLSSVRMRIKTDVKARNELILREVVSWANLYKPSFIPVFLEYNKAYLRRFADWQRRDNLLKAQKLFLSGVYNITDYQTNNSPQALRAGRSFFSDCFNYLDSLAPSIAVNALRGIAVWFSGEMEALAVLAKKQKMSSAPQPTQKSDQVLRSGEAAPVENPPDPRNQQADDAVEKPVATMTVERAEEVIKKILEETQVKGDAQ